MPKLKRYLEAPIPADEKERLASLKILNILNTPPDERFDRITKMALHLFNVPISTVTLIDSKREWFKSCQGLPKREGERAISFCGHAVLSDGLFVIPDTKKDPRFAKNPMVVGPPYIRFYAGYPLRAADGRRVGVFCIKDRRPRKFSKERIGLLKSLSAWAELELNTLELNNAIKAREKAETKVSELDEVLQLLHKSLKHDLLNDLTTIRGFIELYLKKKQRHDLLEDVITTIEQGANSIKQMSKLESAVSTGAPLEKYQLNRAINQISIFFPFMKINVTGEGTVWADQALLSVIENIFRNAENHGKASRIKININSKDDVVEMNITDDGKGIPSKARNKLFQEGFKYGNTGHTGLGLFIIKKTIERYKGEVQIQSARPRGTSVIIKLPAA